MSLALLCQNASVLVRTRLLRPALVFGAVLASISASPVQAQPELPPSQQPAFPREAQRINPEAQKLVDTMIASYKALKSYSDHTELEMSGVTRANVPLITGQKVFVEATLAWKKPTKLRYEGHTGDKPFLALADEKTIRAINPDYPTLWMEKPIASSAKRPGVVAIRAPRNGGTPFNSTVYDSGGVSLALPFMTDRQSWLLQLQEALALDFDTDAKFNGEPCHVVRLHTQSGRGHITFTRLWIALSDNLLRHLETSQVGSGANYAIAETHSTIRLNPDLPASTWEFQQANRSRPVTAFPKARP